MASFGSDPRQESREMPRMQSVPPVQAVPPTTPAAAESKVAVLGPTLHFKGELTAEEDFILQGSLEGSITNPQSVTIGTEGSVVGDIRARAITIDGKIEGDLHGGESVIVHQTGRVTGNIFAPRVGIVEGAFFKGRIEMSELPAARVATPSRSPIPSALAPGVPLSPEDTERVLAQK